MVRTIRSRTLRRVPRRTPGGSLKKHYKKRKPSKAKCGACGKALAGVVRGRPYQVKKASKSQRRPERPYGGVLCTQCTRKVMVLKAREQATA